MNFYSAIEESTHTKAYSNIDLFGLRTIYIVVFLCCSVLSLFSYGLLYSVCLLYIVVNNDLLQRALQSVTKNGTTVLVAIHILKLGTFSLTIACWKALFCNRRA